jgi:predicted flap endonuclease-1-like 5' DNA nuclease
MLRKLSIIVTLLVAGLSLAGFAFPASIMAEEETGTPWLLWVFVILALVAFVVFVIWWWRRGHEDEEVPAIVGPARQEVVVPTTEELEEVAAEATATDDLTAIEGIGPKISGVFQAAGLTTFAQLAEASVGQLEQILEEADPNLLRLAKPATWPEQARLAAEGRWEELEKLQDELHGGQKH